MPASGKQSTSVQQAIDRLNESRATESGSRPVLAQRRQDALREVRQAAARGFLPSGKRQPGVGCNDEVRWSLIAAVKADAGCVCVHLAPLQATTVSGELKGGC